MSSEFEASLNSLNKKQHDAVEYIDGPLLVIAGPGTGKTQLLSMRAANILHKTDTDPSSILCLTFTNFAANNMRERLFKLIGPTARGIVVKTFHSFAAEIMELYPEHFWSGAQLQTAPDAVQLDIVRQILNDLPLDNPLALRYNGQLTLIKDVQDALKLTKEAGFTPKELSEVVTSNLKYIDQVETLLAEVVPKTLSFKNLDDWAQDVYNLPDQQQFDQSQILIKPLSEVIKSSLEASIKADKLIGKTTNTGKWKRRWLQNLDGQKKMLDEKRRNEWWLALAGVYSSYRNLLHGQGYYDYSDMIIEVNNQLKSNNELRAMVQERFLYIQVDEFQDTNAAQLRLADLVASHPLDEGRPNIMAVGDDDQSIFAFNGAELNNMLSFQKSYKDVKTVVLSDNYRSTSKVLNTAAGIIDNAQMRVVTATGLNKNITAVRDHKKGQVMHLKYPTYEHHIALLADKIIEDFKAGNTVSVLGRTHNTLKDMASALNQKKAPISYELQNNSLEQPLVRSINIVSRAVQAINEGDIDNSDFYISLLLSDNPWQVSADALWKLAVNLRHKGKWLEYLLNSKDKKLKNIGLWLKWLAKMSSYTPLNEMLEYISGLVTSEYLTSPIRQYYFEASSVSASYLSNISAFNNLLKASREFTESKKGTVLLRDYIAFINLQESLEKPLSDTSWFASGSKTIDLLTIHKAKGLEYDVVYILDAIDKTWSPRHNGRKPPANLPMQPYGESLDDYVRLMYVAATRARHTIYAASYSHNSKGEDIISSPLIEHFDTISFEPDTQQSIAVVESSMHWPQLATNKQQYLLKKYVTDFQISATSLLDFLDVTKGGPQYFLERHILRLPEPTTEHMAFGNAVHKALQTAQILTNSDQFKIEKVLEAYKQSLLRQDLPKKTSLRLLEHGQKLLNKLLAQNILKLAKEDLSEYSINNLKVGHAWLGGKIDHLSVTDKSIVISDYKTGGELKSFHTRDKNKAIKAWRHKNQLIFYGLLVKNDARIKKQAPLTGQMIYLEAEIVNDIYLRQEISEEDIEQMSKLVNAVSKHIGAVSFPDTRHYTPDIEGINTFTQNLLNNKLPLK